MPEIRQLTRQVPVEAVIDLGGDSVRVTFDRNGITPFLLSEMQRRLQGTKDEKGNDNNDGDVLAVARMLSHVILSWDVSEEGQPFPPTPENIGKLSVSALAALSRRIGDEAVPSSEEGNASATTSSSRSNVSSSTPESRPNGQEPSPSMTPSVSQSPT